MLEQLAMLPHHGASLSLPDVGLLNNHLKVAFKETPGEPPNTATSHAQRRVAKPSNTANVCATATHSWAFCRFGFGRQFDTRFGLAHAAIEPETTRPSPDRVSHFLTPGRER